MKFLSVNAESGNEQCRKDDLISVIYIMIYFLRRGEFPWHAQPPVFEKIDPKDPLGYKKKMQQDRIYDKYLVE